MVQNYISADKGKEKNRDIKIKDNKDKDATSPEV